MILINILAYRGGCLPKWHAVTGIAAGICAWATVIASLFSFEPLNLLASAGRAVVYPVWFAALGTRLLRGLPYARAPEGEHP
jgi:hypothetical protein